VRGRSKGWKSNEIIQQFRIATRFENLIKIQQKADFRIFPNFETPAAPRHGSENTSGNSAKLQRIQKVHLLRKREPTPSPIYSAFDQVFPRENDARRARKTHLHHVAA